MFRNRMAEMKKKRTIIIWKLVKFSPKETFTGSYRPD